MRAALRRSQRSKKLIAFGLVLPLLLYVVANFVLPMAFIFFKSVDGSEVAAALHRTIEALEAVPDSNVPDEQVFAALYKDILEAKQNFALIGVAKRLNTDVSGFMALLNKTGRQLEGAKPKNHRATFLAIDQRWADPDYWAAIRRVSSPYTSVYLLSAFDLTWNESGSIVQVPTYQRVFNDAWLRTCWIASVVTVLCVVLGYPVAYVMANVSSRVAGILIILILIPFWTSLLVRTIAWLVLLQSQGVINDLGLAVGLWSERLQLIHNRTGVYITMIHILLPYMVLPLYANMRRIPKSYVKAALSLGARPLTAVKDIYWPLTKPGVGAGALFVFILAVGFYVTPAIVGGPTDQMITFYIAFYTNEVLNWGAAAALSLLLFVFTIFAFLVFKMLFGLDRLRTT